MSRKHVGIRNTGTQLYVSQVRSELYGVWRSIRMLQNDHLASYKNSHSFPCGFCTSCDSEVDGIRRAIRHFGGNPQRKGW